MSHRQAYLLRLERAVAAAWKTRGSASSQVMRTSP